MKTYVIQNKCCGIRYFRGNYKWTDKIELAKRYETYKQAEKALNMMDLFVCESHKIIEIEDKDRQIKLLTNRWDKLKEFITGLYAKAEYGGVEYCVTSCILEKMAKLEPKGDE